MEGGRCGQDSVISKASHQLLIVRQSTRQSGEVVLETVGEMKPFHEVIDGGHPSEVDAVNKAQRHR